MKYIYIIQKFMQGRYGIDELYKFLLGLYFSLFVINLFFVSLGNLSYSLFFILSCNSL